MKPINFFSGRRKALSILSLALLVASSMAAAAVDLGTAAAYGVLASTFTRTGGITAIAGDAGYITLSGPGTHTVTGTDIVNPPAQAGTDQNAALTFLNSQACTYSFAAGAVDLGSDATHGPIGVYTPGVYCVTGAMTIGGGATITLSGSGLYIFKSSGAFSTSAASGVLLTGGANACDVFWVPAQATTLGATSIFAGTVIDDVGITVGSTTTWQGRALAFAGTITLDNDTQTALSCTAPATATETNSPSPSPTPSETPTKTVTITSTQTVTPTSSATESSTASPSPTHTASSTVTPSSTATRTVTPTTSPTFTSTVTATPTSTITPIPTAMAVDLGEAGNYNVLADIFTRKGGITTIAGDAGYHCLSGNGTHQVSGANHEPSPPQTGIDQAKALASLNNRTCGFNFPPGAIDLASDTTHGTVGIYTPGVYCVIGAMNIGGGGTVTLNGKGTYIFRSTGAFGTTANSIVVLTNGADACDVFWVPGEATTLGANSTFVGTVIDDAGITVGANVSWRGRALAFNGTVTMDTDSILALNCSGQPAAGGYFGPNAPGKGETFAFPSPARGDTVTFVYRMEEPGRALIRVWNEVGSLVANLEEREPVGPQRSKVSLSGFAPGVYLYRVTLAYDSGKEEKTGMQKFTVVK